MAYSYFDYDGTDTTIQTDISCVSTKHMKAFKVLSEDKAKVTLSDAPLAATFTKNDAGVLCELDTAPSTKIRIVRSTPYNVLMHDFSNGAQFDADSVDEVYEQLLYLCQEIVEGKLNLYRSSDCIPKDDLQEQLATQYDLGYDEGKTAGDAAGYTRGYGEGKTAGDAVGYTRGYGEGKTAGDAVGYTRGYNVGYAAGDAAGYTRGYGEVKIPTGVTMDKYGRAIYPIIVKFTEFGLDANGNTTGDDIISQSIVYAYFKNPRATGFGNRNYLSDPGTAINLGVHVVDGYVTYIFKGEYNTHVRAELVG